MNDRKEKLPAILFYPGDWNSDPQLKLCSLAAQGFWMRLLCVMHTCVPYGHLTFRDNLPASNKEAPWIHPLRSCGTSMRCFSMSSKTTSAVPPPNSIRR